jgi:hypothetical protein
MGTTKITWSNNEINKLKELYPNSYNVDIATIMNRPLASINSKSFRLGLKKSKYLLHKMSVNNNLIRISKGGRNLSLENLKNR